MLLACCLAFTPPLPESYLDQYCIGCHSDEDAEAGLDLATLVERNDALADESSWIHILERIRRRDMPPEDHRRQPGRISLSRSGSCHPSVAPRRHTVVPCSPASNDSRRMDPGG